MAAHDSDYGRLALYFKEAYRFNFFQAVKLLEAQWRYRLRERGLPDTLPSGGAPTPEEESVRFRSTVSQAFQASDVGEIDPLPLDDGPPIIQVNFMGLAGARGPLPHYFTKLVRDRVRVGDTSLRDFLDLFNHRLISLLYRTRQCNRPSLNTRASEEHPFGHYLMCIAGAGAKGTCEAFDALKDERAEPKFHIFARDLIMYCGLLWQRERSMDGLTRLLGHFFEREFTGRELCGKWLRLHEDERTRLSAGKITFNKLGATTIVGCRVWDAQSGFELSTEPMSWQDFSDFLPTGRYFTSFVKLVNFYTRSAFDFHLNVQVKGDEVMANRPTLSVKGQMRLGWTSWIMSGKVRASHLKARVPGRLAPDLL